MTDAAPLAAVFNAAAEGERFWFVGTLAIIRVAGEQVGDRFSLMEFLLPQHASPPRHTHPQDETFFLLDGHITFAVGDERIDHGPGGIAAFPAGVVHTFLVRSESARALVLSTPAGLERMVRDIGVSATAATLPPPDTPRPPPDEMERLFALHAQQHFGPPLTPDE
jgi:quercetin dioxygenase-like cupin family protein